MKRRYYFDDYKLFLTKIGLVFGVTALLVPLVYYKLYLPAGVYISVLLAMHLAFLYIYAMRVQWRKLLEDRTAFGVRVVAVVFFVYLLSVVTKFHGSFAIVMLNLASAFGVHVMILSALMLHTELIPVEEEAFEQE